MTEYKNPNFPALYVKGEKDIREHDRFLLQVLDEWNQNIRAILDKGINDDNIDQRILSYTSNGAPDTEDAVTHTLGKIPIGFRVVNSDKAVSVYDSGTAWTKTTIYLKADVATVALKLEVF